MKILHIFGAVVAVHLAVFLVIFAVPGCRSTGKTSTASANTDPSATAAPLGAESAPLSAGASSPVPVVDTSVAYTPPANVRFSPTRPSPGASTGVAAGGLNGALDTPASNVTYVVVKGDSLWTVAKKNGVSVNDLVKANKLKANSPLQLGQKLVIPNASGGALTAASVSGSGSVDKAAAALAAETTGPTHTVQGGETLGTIARKHGTTVNTLKRMNGLTSDSLRPGRVLMLPEGSVSSMEPAAPVAKSTPVATPSRSSGGSKHVVKNGETLGAIARMYGISAGELSTANNITDPRKLQPGKELTIPGGGSAKARPASSSVATPAQETTTSPAPAPTQPEAVSPLTPVEPATSTPANTEVPVIRIEDPNRTPGGEAPRVF